jgi:plastocyanin
MVPSATAANNKMSVLDLSFRIGVPLGENETEEPGKVTTGAMRRMRLVGRHLATALGVVACVSLPLVAQGTVAGRIAITERPGEKSTDIGNAIIYLVRTDSASAATESRQATIAMNGRTFVPRVQVVTPGSRVDFPNQDPFSHNIFSTTPGAIFDLGLYPSGKSKTVSFRRAGVFPVYCNIHPRMTSFVVVSPTPWFTQAGADGRWSIPNVPAGEYRVHVWHERTEEVQREVRVASSGQSGIEVTLDARGFRFAQHKNKFGKEYDKTGKDRY